MLPLDNLFFPQRQKIIGFMELYMCLSSYFTKKVRGYWAYFHRINVEKMD